jgi:hypothetical protein
MPLFTDDLGPLPEGDRQDTIQQLSIKALRNALPEERFLFRDERTDDKGVDGTLEARIEVKTGGADGRETVKSCFTNCRAQVQLKGTDKGKQNQDGSVSYTIDTSNLNYLLNGPSPIYILWIATTGEIRYAWARDEWHRLDLEAPEWKEQDTFTVRFRHTLNAQAIEAIHKHILEEARLARRINESLARSALSERVVVSIDPKTLKSTDPQQIYKWLTESGMTIVSAGFGRQAIEWFDAINPDQRQEPRIQLVVAYAHASLGRNQEAQGNLSAAALRRGDLSLADQRFLEYLRDVCAYQTGRIDLAEYVRREQIRAERHSGIAAAEHRLEVLRQRRLAERDPAIRASLLEEMRRSGEEFQREAATSTAHKLQARIIILGAEGEDLSARFIERTMACQARSEMGYEVTEFVKEADAESLKEWQEWEEKAQSAIRDAIGEGHPLLISDAITMRATIYVGTMILSRMQTAGNDQKWEVNESKIYHLMSEIESALNIYKYAGNLEGATRANLLLADLFELAGQEVAARSLAEGAIVIAEAMEYFRLASRAREHIDGKTMFRQFRARLIQRRSEDDDTHMASESDDAIRSIARYTLDSLQLPLERLPVMEREWFSQRRISRERLNYCRHLQLLQNLTHENHPSTHYRTDPLRICVCGLHAFKSASEVADAEAVIAQFKQAYCDSCSDRSPKG